MTTVTRPCKDRHPDPLLVFNTCPLCKVVVSNVDYRAIFNELNAEWVVRIPLDLRNLIVVRRPCHNRHPSRIHHPECPICIRWETDESFREGWEAYTAETGIKEIPCKYRGPLVPLPERIKYNLGTVRDWYPCAKGFGENGFVCPCRGCGSLCTGYDVPDNPSMIEDPA